MLDSMALSVRITVVLAVCGLAQASQYGMTYGDTGQDSPYLQSLYPTEGPKQGGTMITVSGAGFRDDERLVCRFSRLNPQTETTLTKTTAATYVSSTEIICVAPEWDEDACASCAGSNALSGTFFGHTGSPYLRSSSSTLTGEIGVGDYIKLTAASIGSHKRALTQYYEIAAIQTCGLGSGGAPSTAGCHCVGDWAEDRYEVVTSYNGSGTPNSAPDTGFKLARARRKGTFPATELSTVSWEYGSTIATDTLCALYRYDRIHGGAGNDDAPMMSSTVANGATCDAKCISTGSGTWAAGTKITLAEPVYKVQGKANEMFKGVSGHRAHKHSCTSCKCAGGCVTTLSVSNDGKTYSGNGLNGNAWTGSALAFSLKDIVPTVKYLDLGLPGYRDSTRIIGPASGGTTITVIGENFQQSPLLRCYFAGVRTLVKAEWHSSEKVTCRTPPFFSRQMDDSTVLSQQNGAAMNPHTKVQVTNDGELGDPQAEGVADEHLSRNPYLHDDGSPAYAKTFAVDNSYTSGISANPWRSTCQEGLYPNEGMKPCWKSQESNGATPLFAEASEGNDVLFKYSTCYDAQPAEAVPSMDLYPSPSAYIGAKVINSSQALGQKIKFADMNYKGQGVPDNNDERVAGTGAGVFVKNPDNVAGPLAYLQLQLEKPTQLEATLEVAVYAGNFKAGSTAGCVSTRYPSSPAAWQTSPTTCGYNLLAKETIVVSQIDQQADFKYNVFFNTMPYLLPGTDYYLQVSHVSGAEDTMWKYAAGTGGHILTGTTAMDLSTQFKLKGFSCDGCRTKYSFDPRNDGVPNLRIGEVPTRSDSNASQLLGDFHSETGNEVFSSSVEDKASYRSMLAQEFRPSDSGTLTHAYLKLKTETMTTTNGVGVTQTTDDQSFVSVWITQHGKYGEYVCTVYGGLQTANTCDSDSDGNFNDACALGAVCNPELHLNGGCGDRGVCEMAKTVTNAHILRPETGGAAGPCGHADTCADTMTLRPDHMKILTNVNGWVEFEFKTPVPVEKWNTYFINIAVIGNTDVSKEVVWYSGVAWGDGGATERLTGNAKPAGAPANIEAPSDELRAAYHRGKDSRVWSKVTERVMATKFTRCVSSTAQTLGFVASGEKTGCCAARVSPQGGNKGAKITLTGRNFYPSDRLSCIFRTEDGALGYQVPCHVSDYSFSSCTCEAPTFDPHGDMHRDCSNPSLCQGTTLVATNDGYTAGPQLLGPKWADNHFWRLSFLGQNPVKILFSEIYVSPTGSDLVGDGTQARPYATIQRGLDASNEYDQVVLMPGTYTGAGNRGLRHHGKKIQMMAYVNTARYLRQQSQAEVSSNLENGLYKMREQWEGSDNQLLLTVIDCQHAPDGFILNNNKDSDSPFAGHIDIQDIVIKNCENLRIYDI